MPGSDKMDIDPASLRAASQRMQGCADALTRSVGRLSASVTGAGSPWGSDEMGTLFGMAYTEATQLGMQALSHLGAQLDGVAEALAKIGQAIDATDKEQAKTFNEAGTTQA